jgi:hypothetical protein
MADHDGSDKVGFARPPKASQFKKGQSGNPAGRPKRRTLRTELEDELQVVVTVTENGKKERVTKGRAFWKAVLARAVGGDMRAAGLIATTVGVMPELDEPSNDNAPAAEDQAVLDEFKKREAERLRRLDQDGEVEPPEEVQGDG